MVNLILALAMALALPASAAETSTCARIKVSGAGDCAQLKASLDISRCSDSKAVGSTQVQCEGEHARLTLKARKTTYTAAVELGPESWGVRKWVPKGPVARESQATHAEFQRRPAPPAKEAASEAAPAASATPAPAPALAPSATPAPAAPSVTFNGLFDLYYAYGFNRPRPAVNSFRNFDFFDNEFALNLVELTMQAQVGKVAFKTDLDFGEMADAMNGGIGTADEVAKHIGQAVVTFTPNDRFTLNVGKMATHMGFEVTKARDNWNYSRSFLFALAIPYWHLGACASYVVAPGTATVTAYLYNGWNLLRDNNSAKTFGAQLNLTPIDGLSIYYNLITGAENAGDNGTLRTVHDVNATYTLSGAVTVATDLAIGSEAKSTWTAWELLAKWQVSPRYYLAPRFEIYSDPNGFSTLIPDTQLMGLTLTAGVSLADKVETRLELRRDSANHPAFNGHDGLSADQMTASASLLFSI